MFQGKPFFSLKKGVVLAFASSSAILLLMAHHLLAGSGIRAMLSSTHHKHTLHHSSPSLASVASSGNNQGEHFTTGISSSEKSVYFGNQLTNRITTSQDGDSGRDRLFTYNASSLERENIGPVVSCTDSLCTNFLSSSEKETFVRCQHNATRRVNRFRKRKKAGLDLLLNSANAVMNASNFTASGGVGNCRFMDGGGVKVTCCMRNGDFWNL